MRAHVLDRAEDVCPDVLRAIMLRNETRCRPAGLFLSAWSYTEYALGRQLCISDEEREWHIDSANQLLGRVINDSGTTQDTRLGAMILSTYLPLFKKRAFDERATRGDARDIYTSIAASMSYMRPPGIDEPFQWRMTEAVLLALSARTRQPDFLLYPASPREETSEVQPQNHDSYFLIDGVRKIPTQQKLVHTGKVYEDSVMVVALFPIIEKAMRKHCGSQTMEMSRSEQINYLIGCIIAEANSSEAAPHEIRLLNHLSEAVVSHYHCALAKVA